jgi:hypothetical protein
MVATDDDRNCSGVGDFTNELHHTWHTSFDAELIDRGVAIVDSFQLGPPAHHAFHASAAASGSPKGVRSLSGASKTNAHIDGRANDGHFDFPRFQVIWSHGDR